MKDALNTSTTSQQSQSAKACVDLRASSVTPLNNGNSSSVSSVVPSNGSQSPQNASTAVLPTPDLPPTPVLVPKYLELCINTGKLRHSLGEIDVTHFTTDAILFAWVRKRYKQVRGPLRHWTHYLIKPIAMKFVLFGLENKEKVFIFKEDVYPTEKHITAKTWHYAPCPLDTPPPMPSTAFIHYLRYCTDENLSAPGSRVWLDRLPKKLSESLMRSSDPLVPAFGLHIIEGIDTTAVLWTLLCLLSVCSGPLIAYVVLTKDVQGMTGVGGLLVSTLTLLWMATKISEYSER
jgi:hypothetical protein